MVQRAYFYRPPQDGTSVRTIAQEARLIILTMTDESYRTKLRLEGYEGPVLQYLMAAELDGPTTAITGTVECDDTHVPWPNQVAYHTGDFCRLAHSNESWFLHNGQGERIYGRKYDGENRAFYQMNPASEGWRTFFLQRARTLIKGSDQVHPLGYDGIFLDNVDASMSKVLLYKDNSDGVVQEFESEAAYIEAWTDFLRMVSAEFRPQWPVWANVIADPLHEEWQWKPHLNYLDGVMIESFATGWSWADDPHTPTEWERNLFQAEAILDMGKGHLAVGQGVANGDDSLQEFALASHLLIADGYHAFFHYAEESRYEQWTRYENYKIELGEPLTARYLMEDGRWRRNFRDGVVTVDPVLRRGYIELFDTQEKEE